MPDLISIDSYWRKQKENWENGDIESLNLFIDNEVASINSTLINIQPDEN